MPKRRVVVTGFGVSTPVGFSAEEAWSAVQRSTPAPRVALTEGGCPLPWAGVISFIGLPVRKKEINRMNRADALGVVAALRAAVNSGWTNSELGKSAGLFLGTTKDTSFNEELLQLLVPIARHGYADGAAQMVETATRYLSPFALLDCMPNLALHYISEILKLRGDNCCFLQTGAAGTCAVISAYQAVRSGRTATALAGGFDSTLDRLNLARLSSLGLLAAAPAEAASRPFDRKRDGFLPGEGSAVLVLEDREAALARGANIQGEILGAGSGCEPAYDRGHQTGIAVERALRAALASAHVAPGDIGFITACGEGTVAGDRAEACGIRDSLDGAADRVPVTAFKGVFGHLMAASGPLECVMALCALSAREIPSICGCDEPDESCGLRLVREGPLETSSQIAVVISTGLGGQACALVLGRRDWQ